MWGYRELPPLPHHTSPVGLVEGGTPLVRLDVKGPATLWTKDETRNPTGAAAKWPSALALAVAPEALPEDEPAAVRAWLEDFDLADA